MPAQQPMLTGYFRFETLPYVGGHEQIDFERRAQELDRLLFAEEPVDLPLTVEHQARLVVGEAADPWWDNPT